MLLHSSHVRLSTAPALWRSLEKAVIGGQITTELGLERLCSRSWLRRSASVAHHQSNPSIRHFIRSTPHPALPTPSRFPYFLLLLLPLALLPPPPRPQLNPPSRPQTIPPHPSHNQPTLLHNPANIPIPPTPIPVRMMLGQIIQDPIHPPVMTPPVFQQQDLAVLLVGESAEMPEVGDWVGRRA